MKRLRYIQLALAGLSLVLLSCADDREPVVEVPHGVPAEIEVTIAGMERPETRRTTDDNTDHWTTKSFSSGDQIGLFSTGGLMVNGMSDSLRNGRMDYYQATGSSNYKFRNEELLINTGLMGGKVAKYVYFPYTEDMPWPRVAVADNVTSNQYYSANPLSKDTRNSKDEYTGTYAPHIEGNKFKDGMLLRRVHSKYAEQQTIEKTVGNETKIEKIYVTKEKQKTTQGIDIPAGVVVLPDDTMPDDGVIRCVDYMYISSISLTNGALGGGFYHGFSEMIILRGEGFDKPRNEVEKHDIKVVLDRGVTRLTLGLHLENSTATFTWRPKLWPAKPWPSSSSAYVDGKYDGLTEAEAKEWYAWKGAEYVDTKDDGTPYPREAWYVLLPTEYNYTNTIVDYIELPNNEGIPCKVSNFDLNVDATTGITNKNLNGRKRYAVEVMMTEHGAIARPVEISDWIEEDPIDPDNPDRKDSHNITDERTKGIMATNLEEWIIDYRTYINNYNDSRPASQTEVDNLTGAPKEAFDKMLNYGDYIIESKRWRFYITEDIDISKSSYEMPELHDIISGPSEANHSTISNLTKKTFIPKILEGGALQNLDFDNLYVRGNTEGAAGALTNELDGGTIENCRINNGTMVGTGGVPIGMIAGTVTDKGGTVKNCTLSGAVIGTTAEGYAGLFGVVTDGVTPTVTGTTNSLIVK